MNPADVNVPALSVEDKRALLARVLGEQSAEATPSPLSFAQQRLWFLNRLDPGNAAQNMHLALRLRGRLDVEAFREAIGRILLRHDVLRSRIRVTNGVPLQVVEATTAAAFSFIDRTGWPQDGRTDEMQRTLLEEGRRPFDLSQDPPLRLMLLRLGTDEHIALMTVHHIAFDGWSRTVMMREMASFYSAALSGTPAVLDALPIQYADFAFWQRQQARGEAMAGHLAYWKRRLTDLPTLLLPTDRPRPARQSFRGGTCPFVSCTGLFQKLKALARHEGVTPFMVLLAGVQALLGRYSGQEDVAVGSPLAGRTRAETEGLIGCFVNTVVLRTDLSGDPTFRQLLARVRAVTLEAYEHQDLPFERLVEELRPERSAAHNPLFQVMVVLQGPGEEIMHLSDLEASRLNVPTDSSSFDLTFSFTEGPEGLAGGFHYSTDLFDHATVVRLAGHLNTLLEGAVSDPERPLSELPLLTPAERQQLLREWNDTSVMYRTTDGCHRLFERQAELRREATAVVADGEKLTYGELNRRANRLAHHLRSLGVGPEVPVGLCVERSAEMVVAILAILKAGGAYVPLDPAYPVERLAVMIAEARVRLLLTQERLREKLPPEGVARVVCLEADRPFNSPQEEENPADVGSQADLAYVIFTSGTTGRPKGVMVTHGNVSHAVEAMGRVSGILAEDVYLHTASIGFSSSVRQLLLPLTHGAAVVIATAEQRGNPKALLDAVQDHQVTILDLVPSHWRTCIETLGTLPPEAPRRLAVSSLRLVLSASEVLRSDLPRDWRSLVGDRIRIINMFGQTETTGIVTCFSIPSYPAPTDGVLPIGRPIVNTEAYILDRHLKPVPVGVPGQLYIAGAGLARGYLNDDLLTERRFLKHPLTNDVVTRLYQTGDRARYRADGNIEYLGRTDHQVKIRGFRIELEEVQAALLSHPSIGEAVVVAVEETPGERWLAAYVRSTADGVIEASEIFDYLRRTLPDYMIPSRVIPVDDWPVTPNGKLDRRSLPVPDPPNSAKKASYVAPRTETEHLLAGLWSRALRAEQVGIEDNFFDLGGHSLLAASIMSQANAALKTDLPLRSLFDAPTIGQLSLSFTQRLAEQAGEQSAASILAEIEGLSDDEAAAAVITQEADWSRNCD